MLEQNLFSVDKVCYNTNDFPFVNIEKEVKNEGMSMTLFPFLYAIAFVILITAVLSTACCLYVLKKRDGVAHIIGLYLFYLIDAVIVFQLECSPNFNAWFERGFVYNPAIKTVVFAGCAFFSLSIFNDLFRRRMSKVQIGWLIALGLYLLILPLMGLKTVSAWCYFTSYQVFTIGWSIYGLKLTKGMEDGNRKKVIRFLMLISILFSVLIALEDGIVIFNYDSYTTDNIVIHIRNISEDILHVMYSLVFLSVCFKNACTRETADEQAPEETEKELSEEAEPAEESMEMQAAEVVAEFKTIKFAQELILTGRELEVFQEMVAGKSNQQISEELCISMGTVKAHVHNIFQKAGVTHRYELMRKFDAYDMI